MAAAESSQPSVPNDHISDRLQTARVWRVSYKRGFCSVFFTVCVYIRVCVYFFPFTPFCLSLSFQAACKLMRLVEAERKYGVQFHYSH